ncbi:hypothetical protein K474DRAFT_1462392 [Panus rudis PR-1116 ss-1]|nr:hypothetical protein K474DRAFT_1462392 [Panus rudis PR-1116 ss-1]
MPRLPSYRSAYLNRYMPYGRESFHLRHGEMSVEDGRVGNATELTPVQSSSMSQARPAIPTAVSREDSTKINGWGQLLFVRAGNVSPSRRSALADYDPGQGYVYFLSLFVRASLQFYTMAHDCAIFRNTSHISYNFLGFAATPRKPLDTTNTHVMPEHKVTTNCTMYLY